MRTKPQSWAQVATPTVADTASTIPPRRRWLRFSLRSLLILITVLSIWLGVKVNQARRQKEAVAALRQLGATVYYSHQRRDTFPNSYDLANDLSVPGWLRELAGDDFFQSAACVQVLGPVTDDALVHLAALPHLESLKLSLGGAGVSDAGLANLPRPDRLVYCLVDGTSVGDEFVKRLAGARRLETLSLGGTRVSEQGLRSLGELSELKSLALDNTPIGDAGLKALPGMPALETLQISGTRVTDAGLAHIVRFKRLLGIQLNHTAISDAGLAHLAALPRLRELDLQATQVRGPGLAKIVPGLSGWLNLKDTPIDDESLVYLREAIELQVLNLEGTAVTDAGMERLRRLPKLSLICLEGTQVTKEGIAVLTKALPNLGIVSKPNGT
jgi:hypothetical protein